jgi:hypothetical protein
VKMTRWCLGTLGAALIAGSLLALGTPLKLEAVDSNSKRIACGSGLSADYIPSRSVDSANMLLHNADPVHFAQSTYADDCLSWIQGKRDVALRAATVGLLFLLGAATTTRTLLRRVVRSSSSFGPASAAHPSSPSSAPQLVGSHSNV